MSNSNQDNHTTNNELQRDLGRVEGKIDGILAAVTSIHNTHVILDGRISEVDKRLSERVSKVENRQYWFSGLAAAAGFVAAKLTTIWHG